MNVHQTQDHNPVDYVEAFEMGWFAYLFGISEDDCPLTVPDNLINAWHEGWMASKANCQFNAD